MFTEETIEYVREDYKIGGIFGKKIPMRVAVYPSTIDIAGLFIEDGSPSDVPAEKSIKYSDLQVCEIRSYGRENGIYFKCVGEDVLFTKYYEAVVIIKNCDRVYSIIIQQMEKYRAGKLQYQEEERSRKEKEETALKLRNDKAKMFYDDCYNFHIGKDNNPSFALYIGKYEWNGVYLAQDKSFCFLRINGYSEEENCGSIPYDKIHYYEKAGTLHYVPQINGSFSSYGGSIEGGSIDGGRSLRDGLLFGLWGLAEGALLSHEPMQVKPQEMKMEMTSITRTVDDRNVILNYYSDSRASYMDLELPKEIYNFLQTYLPEKKHSIVQEMETQTAVRMSATKIESGELLKAPIRQEISSKPEGDISSFQDKVNKLKMMYEAGLLSDEEFDAEKRKLLSLI